MVGELLCLTRTANPHFLSVRVPHKSPVTEAQTHGRELTHNTLHGLSTQDTLKLLPITAASVLGSS